ncbi:MAG: hypothetical protein IPG96_00760 [Proteobacteria bacterium]|nr:hypothetical protein [Pseudomonadota bacterium]
MTRLWLGDAAVELRCETLPPAVQNELRAYFTATNDPWVTEGPLASARSPLLIDVEQVGVLPPASGEPVFFHGSLQGFAAPSAAAVETLWLHDRAAVARLQLATPTLQLWVTEGALARPEALLHNFVLIALAVTARTRGLFHLHAGTVVAPTGTAALIVGDARAGKTTTTLALVTAGWQTAGDDAAWLSLEPAKGRVRALGVRRPFHLRPLTRQMFPQLDGALVPPPPATTEEPKWSLDAPAVFSERWLTEAVDPGLLILPMIGDEARSSIAPAAADEGFARLLRASALVLVDGLPQRREHLRVIERLLAQTRALTLYLGRDALAAPSCLAALVQRALSAVDGAATGRE